MLRKIIKEIPIIILSIVLTFILFYGFWLFTLLVLFNSDVWLLTLFAELVLVAYLIYYRLKGGTYAKYKKR